MIKYGDTYELHLTPTQALGVALSCGPMINNIMDEAQAAAIPMMEHLEAMGFIVIEAPLLMNSHGATVEFDEYLCPNCLTPWKCNGPHIPEDRG